MIMFIINFTAITIGFHLIMDFLCKKMNLHNRYPLLKVRLERGEKLPLALLKYCTDYFVWGVRFVFILAISFFVGNHSQSQPCTNYWQAEAEKEANAQKMVDDYGGKLSDYL